MREIMDKLAGKQTPEEREERHMKESEKIRRMLGRPVRNPPRHVKLAGKHPKKVYRKPLVEWS